jgi:hypothetical protein
VHFLDVSLNACIICRNLRTEGRNSQATHILDGIFFGCLTLEVARYAAIEIYRTTEIHAFWSRYSEVKMKAALLLQDHESDAKYSTVLSNVKCFILNVVASRGHL